LSSSFKSSFGGKLTPFSTQQRILGIDYGEKVIGLALYAPGIDLNPYPFDKLVNQNQDQVFAALKKILENEEITTIIVGVPYLLDGKTTKMTNKIMDFSKKLKQVFSHLEVKLQDETLTTFEAKDRMKQDPRYHFKVDLREIDSLCAAIIIEDFIKQTS
jgi:putative Holliday junction resolvase